MPEFRMRYQVQMADEQWDFFQRLGVDLKQDREEIGFPDSVIEMTDEKLLSLYDSQKHCFQACSAIAGVEARAFPKSRVVDCAHEFGGTLLLVGPDVHGLLMDVQDVMPRDLSISSTRVDDLIALSEGKSSIPMTPIVIGYQSWHTYTASTLGLPVIEVLQKGRAVNWFSKWQNAAYRMIEYNRMDRLPGALHSIEGVLKWASSQAAVVKADVIPTEAGESTAPVVRSTSQTPSSHLAK